MQTLKEQLTSFETEIAQLWESGELPCLTHLCGGNEEQLIEIFKSVNKGDWILSSHRNHYHALLSGIPRSELKAAIMDGNSMFTFSREHNFYSSAILAGCCGIAAGVAWSLKRAGSPNKVLCFLGDGAEEQGHFYEAALFVEANDLPCTFWIENNNRQVDTPKVERRGKKFAPNNPLSEFKCVEHYTYESTYPHAGSGTTKRIIFNPDAIKLHAAKNESLH